MAKQKKKQNKQKRMGTIVLYSYSWIYKRKGVRFPKAKKNCSIIKTRLSMFSTEIFNIWSSLEETDKTIFTFYDRDFLKLETVLNHIYDDRNFLYGKEESEEPEEPCLKEN